jgi:cytoskeletal protein RodZ
MSGGVAADTLFNRGLERMARGNFGERLKRERELREVSLEEITAATRIAPRFLEALENENWDQLPGGVFNRGFVRSVARYLGLNEEALIGEYDLAHGAPVNPPTQRHEDRIPAPSKWLTAAVFLGILVLLAALVGGGFYAWRYFKARRAQKQSSSVIRPAPPMKSTPYCWN